MREVRAAASNAWRKEHLLTEVRFDRIERDGHGSSPAPASNSSRNTAARSPLMMRRMSCNASGEIDVPGAAIGTVGVPHFGVEGDDVTSRSQLTQMSTTGPDPSRASSLK